MNESHNNKYGVPDKTHIVQFPKIESKVSFDRQELQAILNVYGRKVALGEWRDYAIDFDRHQAVFAVFRRTSEYPLYKIVKDPRLARKQGMYAVIAQSGQILKRGIELVRVLSILEKPVRIVDI
ncbi:DUF2794 domain-containing protein [Microvirga sp. W0021]|uniref:DUF2794 domain-containing protein n=1 Tax=Hohaiivirga grylli TaxID=3133970 RepID=A0ABV0BI72_9HYPH